MKNILIGFVAAASIVGALIAQTKINPTDPQPTCSMCPGTYIPVSELQAYTKKAIDERLVDQQVRDVEIDKHRHRDGSRGKLDAPAANSVAEHDQVSEVYHIIDGHGRSSSVRISRTGSAVTNTANSPRVQRTRQQRLEVGMVSRISSNPETWS
jgi:hypothetical protein